MNGPQGPLNDLVADDDLLYKALHHYVLEREDGWCDIYVCRMVAGLEVGAIYAIPKFTWQSGYETYYGYGRTEDEALRDCLQKLKGVPHACVFPTLTLDEPQEENGHKNGHANQRQRPLANVVLSDTCRIGTWILGPK